MRRRLFAVITGGGTAGHVAPALAVAEALVASGHSPEEIEFVGSSRGIESVLVPAAGFRLHTLPGRGIRRRFCKENASAVLGILAAFFLSLAMAARRRPQVVVSVGGYAGLAYALAALALGVPLVVVNVDSVPGAANRLLARFAAANAVAFEGTRLPRATVTGPPVRRAVLAASRGDAARSSLRARIGVDEKRTLVVVTGGSLGAGSLNEAALGLAGLWADRSDIAIYHLAGERNLEEMKELAALAGVTGLSRGSLQYRLAGYDPALPQALAAADLVVSRAGASTVAELTAIGVPSILVPLPRAPSDHQAKNAEKLARRGAAVVLPDERLSAEALAGEISALSAGGRLAEMAEAAAALGRPEAADEVAAMAIDAAGGRRSPE